MGALFGGGKAQKEAQRQAELARQQQAVANNRQLAELNRSSERATLSRSRPRGRRLFADSGDSQLKTTLG